MANPLNVTLGQPLQPLGASHAVVRPIEPDKDDEDDEFLPTHAAELQTALSGPVIPDRSRWLLGGFLKR